VVEWRLYQCGAYHEDDAAFGFGRLTGDGTARLFCVITFNAPSNCDNKEKEGPPATGKGTLLGVRLQPALLGRLDEWAESQEDKPSRPEAIRRLVEKALPPVRPKRTSPPGERTAKATKREADTRIRFVARSTRSCPLLRSDGACALRARCEAMRSRKGVRGGATGG
jgi:hypothetical protein